MIRKTIPLICTVFVLSCSKKHDAPPTPFLNFNQTSVSVSPVPGTVTDVIVESNIDWQLSFSAGADWLQADKTSGHGNDTIHVTVLADNSGSQSRTATITASPVNTATSLTAQLTIEQKVYNVQLLSQKVYGGTSVDELDVVIPINDGGLLLAGYTSSSNTGMVRTNHGSYDGWIVRLNSNLDTVWTRVMGGTGADVFGCGTATTDGGFVLGGYTSAVDGDVTGTPAGKADWRIVKLNGNGDTVWTRLLGGPLNDFPRSMTATADGGFIIAGQMNTSGTEIDGFVVKLNGNGEVVWQKTLGGTGTDIFWSVGVATDGSILLGGSSASNNTGNVGASHGGVDMWVTKLSSNGDLIWNKLFGGDKNDEANSLKTTPDGGCIIAGTTSSNATGDVGASYGDKDIWVVKLNANGDTLYTTLAGGSATDYSRSITATPDGGFVVAGFSNSANGDIALNQGDFDVFTMKLNNKGKKIWTKTFGGNQYDYTNAIVLNADNSFYLTGYTQSNNSGDVGAAFGSGDAWLIKIKDF